MTERLQASRAGEVARAAELLRGGGTVAFPTETVYGLGANALDAAAVAKIFTAKERPGWDPLIVHVCDRAMLDKVADVSEKAEKLIGAFWPGPLTLLLPRLSSVPDAVTAGRKLVGVRMPNHPVALQLIRLAGLPVAAPSANRFGRTSPTRAEHVLTDLEGRIDAVLDGGPTEVGVESTVLDVSSGPVMIYRPGAVTAEELAEVLGEKVEIYRAVLGQKEAAPEGLPSPGVGIRHYAPRARLVLVPAAELEAKIAEAREGGARVGIMAPEGLQVESAVESFAWGRWQDPEGLARRLFAGLRDLDSRGVEMILCPIPVGGGIAEALRDRLEKAARKD